MYTSLSQIPPLPKANFSFNIEWRDLRTFIIANKYELNPSYQRGYVWTTYQKERYIEHILRNGRSGRDILWNCPNWQETTGDSQWHDTLELVDGKQRLEAVSGFLAGTVQAFGKYLPDYSEGGVSRGRLRYDFVFHVNTLATKREVIDWYLGINAGGSMHTKDDLHIARQLLG